MPPSTQNRQVLGTFADQFQVLVGDAAPGIALTYTTALAESLGVGPQNGAFVTIPPIVAEAQKGIYHGAAINGDLAYSYGGS